MFALLRFLWIVLCATPLIVTGVRHARGELSNPRRSFTRAAAGGILGIALLIAVRIAVFFFVEQAWYSQLAAADRFWTEYLARIAVGLAAFIVALAASRWVIGAARHRLGARSSRRGLWIVGVVIGLILGLGASGLWEQVLLFINRAETTLSDPAFGLSLRFYLFTLPLVAAVLRLFGTLLFLLALGVLYMIFAEDQFDAAINGDLSRLGPSFRIVAPVIKGLAAAYLLRLAVGRLVAIPVLAISRTGAVYGANWMDVHVGMPTLIVAALVYLAAAVWVVTLRGPRPERAPAVAAAGAGGAQRNFEVIRGEDDESEDSSGSGDSGEGNRGTSGGGGGGGGLFDSLGIRRSTLIVPAVLVGILIIARGLVPAVVRPLVLEPNEITLEEPYLESNIAMTQHAYGLDEQYLTSTQYQVAREVTPSILEGNQETLSNIRLWDPRALLDNLRQQQEIRLYYQFNDVDIDRYTIDGEYTQLMLSVRELEKSALAEESQTWVSRHLKYTHGYGLVALPVHTVLPDGRPDLLVQNIPTESSVSRLELSQPRVYYGERTRDHVYTGTTQQEFDYPADEGNRFNEYSGDGGVPIGGLLRRLIYASRVDGTRQLFSSYITPDTRLHWRRSITDRARRLAPFLRYDNDPYPVVTNDGRIVYVIDAYTVARTHPYSEHYRGRLDNFQDVNYIRNSVKVFVDAYHGTVDFYAMTEDDPILTTYRSIFPELFAPADEMPDGMMEHIRYPTDFMTVQADMYRTYHMEDAVTFYQREDLWEFATERYRENFQPVEPYYALINFPDQQRAEFVAMLPFTPANKNVIHSWMAARSDQPNYGDLTVYTFPKGVEVLGPRQIEARIDQNTEMSRALSLWSQRGSNVIRGNLLAIPLFADNELVMLFSEPIFLQAEDASLPEIKRIALADQERVVWSNRFDAALDLIAGDRQEEIVTVTTTTEGGDQAQTTQAEQPAVSAEARAALQNAREELDAFARALEEGAFEDAGRALEQLREALQN